jgi:hypothetical protein
MEIQLSSPKDITVIKEVKKTVDKITVFEITDNPIRKSVIAKTSQIGPITLWEGDDYDAIGQWTDTDAINRINELYNS